MEMKQQHNQDRRLKTPMQQANNNINNNNQSQNQNQQQQQKCPRCESLNTKFCYYNNYSLSQPRYFCKTCRRYWTQGGTLRNVPVGGGCRKGKRMKTSNSSNSSSSGENSRLSLSGINTNINNNNNANALVQNLNSTTSAASASLVVDRADLASSSSTFNYPGGGGGFLNSLAAIQSSLSNQPVPPQTFPLTPLGGVGGTSNLNLLHGFNAIAAPNSFGPPPPQQQQQRPFYLQNWHQSFLNGDNNNLTIPDTALWSISTSTTTANSNSNNNNATSFPMNPSDHQWRQHEHHLQGYAPPP